MRGADAAQPPRALPPEPVLGAMLTTGIGIARASDGDDQSMWTAWIPDMEQIFNSALYNMFESAGEKFTDPELKAFYERLTGDRWR